MKKIILFSIAFIGCFLCASFIIGRGVESTKVQASAAQNPIPEAVTKILTNSCNDCHGNPGKEKALLFFDLSDWDKLSMKKQAAEASKICKMVTNDKMPPSDYKEKYPEKALSQDDVKTICDWAESLQKPKK
jgi:hypothetical protein